MKFANIIAPKPRGSRPPSRGAWIEIMNNMIWFVLYKVAPLAGGVD